MAQDTKQAIVKRLNRIAGQATGVARMVEEGRYCIDVLHQVQAIKAALARVEDAVLKDHAASCVAAAIKSGDPEDQKQKFDELIDLMGRFKH